MKHRPFKDSYKSGESPATIENEVAERRSSTRKPIVTSAQVIEVATGARLRARSCDLVVKGCYIDTLNPFPAGTLVRIRLEKENATFEATGKVVYRLPGLGMGITFLDLTPENKLILEQWLSGFGSKEDSFEVSLSSIKGEPEKSLFPKPLEQIEELIQLLHLRGIISKSDAATLLRQSLD